LWPRRWSGLVERLEAISGRRLDRDALRERLERVNHQEEVFDSVRRLIASAPETPVRMTEQISNVMATQWVRGSEWALAHARAFHDEVRHRVESGISACPGERARLMWVGAGLWHDTDFYTAFEASHRAVFVWSMYLAFGPDGYIRYGLDDPMAALASRTASFNEYLHNPPWAAEWIVQQARDHRIDGALVLRPHSMKPAATGRLFIERALENAAFPCCRSKEMSSIRASGIRRRRVRRCGRFWKRESFRHDNELHFFVAIQMVVAFRRDAGRDVCAATVEPRLLPAAAVDPAGIRHEL
jgi:benzoyl-CoA reductase/2-hydroxyglutaryl-CoA dehydratase subunit BcrC/BadD/HgdB